MKTLGTESRQKVRRLLKQARAQLKLSQDHAISLREDFLHKMAPTKARRSRTQPATMEDCRHPRAHHRVASRSNVRAICAVMMTSGTRPNEPGQHRSCESTLPAADDSALTSRLHRGTQKSERMSCRSLAMSSVTESQPADECGPMPRTCEKCPLFSTFPMFVPSLSW